MRYLCYAWRGVGAELKDPLRRPNPHDPVSHRAYLESTQPPRIIRGYLEKKQSADAVFDNDAKAALGWLDTHYEWVDGHPPRDARLASTLDLLEHGTDVMWDAWISKTTGACIMLTVLVAAAGEQPLPG